MVGLGQGQLDGEGAPKAAQQIPKSILATIPGRGCGPGQGWGTTQPPISCHLLPPMEDVCFSIPRSCRGRMRLDLLDPTWFSAEAEGNGAGMKPEGQQFVPGSVWGYHGLGHGWSPGEEAGAAWLPFPIPQSIIYLQQNAGRHLAGEIIPLAEKQVSGGTVERRGEWILQFSRYYLAAINRASHTARER